MGFNYYIVSDYSDDADWKRCGENTKYHLGKSSYPYRFVLRTYPDENINTLEDYTEIMLNNNYVVVTENDEKVDWNDVVAMINSKKTGSCQKHGATTDCDCTYEARCEYCELNCDCPAGVCDSRSTKFS